eukprot:2689896-Amphidinium_carterae.2
MSSYPALQPQALTNDFKLKHKLRPTQRHQAQAQRRPTRTLRPAQRPQAQAQRYPKSTPLPALHCPGFRLCPAIQHFNHKHKLRPAQRHQAPTQRRLNRIIRSTTSSSSTSYVQPNDIKLKHNDDLTALPVQINDLKLTHHATRTIQHFNHKHKLRPAQQHHALTQRRLNRTIRPAHRPQAQAQATSSATTSSSNTTTTCSHFTSSSTTSSSTASYAQHNDIKFKHNADLLALYDQLNDLKLKTTILQFTPLQALH